MPDDRDFDEFMAMSDMEADRELAAAEREYAAMIDAMSRDQFYAYRRRKRVDLCRRWRKLIREADMPFLRTQLRTTQRGLVALRSERRAAIYIPSTLQ